MPYVPGPNNDIVYIPDIPGPNNELIPETPHDTSSRFPIHADYAESASWAGTASYFVGFIESASYAHFSETASFLLGVIESASYARTATSSSYSISSSFSRFAATASYLLGSVSYAISCSWAALAGHAITADTASYALFAVSSSVAQSSTSASYAVSAGYATTSQTSVSASIASQALVSVSSSYSLIASSSLSTVSASYATQAQTALSLVGTASYAVYAQTASYVDLTSIQLKTPSGSGASIGAYEVDNISSPTIIDTYPTTSGHSAKWFLSIYDGANFKSSEILAIWNPSNSTTNFAEVTTNSLGTIPVAMSVSLSAGAVRLIANPSSGTWTIKFIRFLL